jgi:uncharacterized protein (TIGR03086 family)
MTDPLAALVRTLDVTATLVAGIGDDGWDAPTPCSGWTVRALVEHVVDIERLVTARLTGAPDPTTDALVTPDAVARHGADLLAAFRRPGALDGDVAMLVGVVPGPVAVELQITEYLVHGWDLARATGQPVDVLPADLAERSLAFTRGALARVSPERSPFAPPVAVDDAAPAIDRLVALLGRDPSGRGDGQGGGRGDDEGVAGSAAR